MGFICGFFCGVFCWFFVGFFVRYLKVCCCFFFSDLISEMNYIQDFLSSVQRSPIGESIPYLLRGSRIPGTETHAQIED
jgi:hypothetical protein